MPDQVRHDGRSGPPADEDYGLTACEAIELALAPVLARSPGRRSAGTWKGRGAVSQAQDESDGSERAAEAALRASEERLRVAQAAGGVGTFEYIPDGERMVRSEER